MRYLILVLAILSGCTVYKSSDRDDFDSNGKARAPQQKAALTLDDHDLLANPCAAFNDVSDDQIRSLFGPAPRLSMTNQISPKTSTCLVTSTSTDLTAPSVLACSWKPVDGRAIPVANDDFAIQTTEDDLRNEGFDVVSSTVVKGETLRMNCEAYVSTPALIEDRRAGEPETDRLSAKFLSFTRELENITLPARTQH